MNAAQVGVEEAGLVYALDDRPGITRSRRGEKFIYRLASGEVVKDSETLDRIQKLAIPPAYEDVWISPLSNGHLQATGRDQRGRKQYRYHPDFVAQRDEAKFGRLLEFAKRLPKIRRTVDRHLRRPGMPREKALAAVVLLLERTLIRVGNAEYARNNQHFGLTTMQARHAQIDGSQVRFKFTAKSGVAMEVKVRDRRIARIVRQLQELPGQELFGYRDESGTSRDVTSADVNAFIREATKGDFTAKDFRTWAGSILAMTELANLEPAATAKERKRQVTQVVRRVSATLGNTASVCRKCYIHPAVIERFTDSTFPKLRGDAERALAALLSQC